MTENMTATAAAAGVTSTDNPSRRRRPRRPRRSPTAHHQTKMTGDATDAAVYDFEMTARHPRPFDLHREAK